MSEGQQHTIFGEPLDEQLRIETTGRVIRPWKRMIDQIAKEYRIIATDDGLRVEAVDSGNVSAIFTEIHADAFDRFELDSETVLGNSGGFGTVLQHARYGKSSDDPITITAGVERIESEVTRTFDETDATISERAGLVDPAAIRESPDLPDLDLSVSAELSPDAFIEVIGLLDTSDSHAIQLASDDESVTFKQDDDITKRNVDLDCKPTAESDFTYFSPMYFEDFANALRNGYVDSLTLRWDEEMPVFCEFEREGLYSGQLMLAPRIRED